MELEFERYSKGYSSLNGTQSYAISQIDLCRHAMQVGYKDRKSYHDASWFKHLELFFMVLANVKEREGELVLTSGYNDLDLSEKVCVSYQMGQGLTKAVAETYFDVPWAVHYKTMQKREYKFSEGGAAKMIVKAEENKGKEPDLVGFDKNGQVHIFESKCSSKTKTDDAVIQKAINQVSNITEIKFSGLVQAFATRNACIFNLTDCFRGRIIDPPVSGENDLEINIGCLPQCVYDYYYDFIKDDNMHLSTLKKNKREWQGHCFEFDGERYFWGINSDAKEFLIDQLFNKPIITNYTPNGQWNDETELEYRNVGQRVLNFFSQYKQEEDDISVSMGMDGFILCRQ